MSQLIQRYASMGPRSENRGYARGRHGERCPPSSFNGSTVREPWLWTASGKPRRTRWGRFNGSTVREPWLCRVAGRLAHLRGQASMGPRSENRGYGGRQFANEFGKWKLQWVHGPRTVVM